jgi:glycosyltransferase involved in cell wall biosynthesis
MKDERTDVTVCISTVNGNLLHNQKFLMQLDALATPVVVVNQVTEPSVASETLKSRLDQDGVLFCEDRSLGLSRSRNLALSNVTTTWALLCDDDVWLNESGYSEMNRLLAHNDGPGSGGVLVQLEKENQEPWRRYGELTKEIRGTSVRAKLDIQKVNSMELVLHAKNLGKHGISFREKWGLGTQPAPGGEEVLLMNDALESGLHFKRLPVPVRIHPDESSGSSVNLTNAFIQGSTCVLIFPAWLYLGLTCWLTFKHVVQRKASLRWGVAFVRGGLWAWQHRAR